MALCSSEDSVIAMADMGSLDRNYGTDRLVNGAIRSSSCYCTFHDTIAFDISDIHLSSVLTSLKVIQIAFIVKAETMEDANVMEELNKQGEKIKGFYELANSGIKVNLTRIIE